MAWHRMRLPVPCAVFATVYGVCWLLLLTPRIHVDEKGAVTSVGRNSSATESSVARRRAEIVLRVLEGGSRLDRVTLPSSGSRMSLDWTLEEEALLEDSFYGYLTNIVSHNCDSSVRLGGSGEGGWDICTDSPFDVSTPCLVYSIGIGSNWAFDDAVSTEFGCQVLAFDPTIDQPDHKRGDRIWFYNAGLSGNDDSEDRTFTFQTLLNQHRHQQSTIDVLKIDIEFSEWAALETMLAQPECLSRVKQLDLEVHLRDAWQPAVSSAADLIRYWRILHGLHEIGFHAWKLHENPVRSCHYASKRRPWEQKLAACYNVFFVNVKYPASAT